MQPVKEYTFDSFITGGSNKFAYMAAKAAANNPGKVYNPLIIFGGSGLGKTHLLNAVYNHIRGTAPDSMVVLLSAEELIQDIVSAIRAKRAEPWYADLLTADVLLIDDAQSILGKSATQAEFASLLCSSVERGHQVVMTSSVDPETLPVLAAGIRTGCDGGLFADIQPLDSGTGRLIVRNKAAERGLRLSEESQEYIASHANGEVRRIEGILTRLKAEEALMGSAPDQTEVKNACESFLRPFYEWNIRMKTAYIMIGIQGSGKSEFCRRYLPDIERINLDTLKTRNNENRMIADCHARAVDYVVDNTNPTKNDRARYIPAAKAKGYRVIGYFMQSRLQECIARNNLRQGKAVVPAKAIAMTSNRLELPSLDEGFDELYFVANDGTEMEVSEWRENDEL